MTKEQMKGQFPSLDEMFGVKNPSKQARDRLHDLLKRHAYKKGEVVLASGKKSNFYIDCKQVFLSQEGIHLAAWKLYELIKPFEPCAVAGTGVGGIPLAVAVSMFAQRCAESSLHIVAVRAASKDHGTRRLVERPERYVPEGSRVVLVEDVLTTGGSAVAAVEALRNEGLVVAAVVALVDRDEGAYRALAQNRVLMLAVFNRHAFV